MNEIFDKYDEDHNDMLDRREVLRMLKEINLRSIIKKTDYELETMADQLLAIGSTESGLRRINREEFYQYYKGQGWFIFLLYFLFSLSESLIRRIKMLSHRFNCLSPLYRIPIKINQFIVSILNQLLIFFTKANWESIIFSINYLHISFRK